MQKNDFSEICRADDAVQGAQDSVDRKTFATRRAGGASTVGFVWANFGKFVKMPKVDVRTEVAQI